MDYAAEMDLFYMTGKDFAFSYMLRNPEKSFDELIVAILELPQRKLPSAMARTTAEQIATRVFQVGGFVGSSQEGVGS